MKMFGGFFKATLIDGLLIILPIGFLLVIGVKFLSLLKPIADPLSGFLPERFRYPMLLSLIIVLLFSLAAGMLALSDFGKSLGRFVETSALNRVPGYLMMRSLTQSIGDADDTRKHHPVFVEIEKGLVIGFIVEEHEDDRYTVFVPTTPTLAVGSVYILDGDSVHIIDAPFLEAVKCVSRFGIGSAELLKSLRHPLAPHESIAELSNLPQKSKVPNERSDLERQ